MFYRIRYLLSDPRVLTVIAIIVVGLVVLLGPNDSRTIAFWVGVVLVVALIVLTALWLVRRLRARKAATRLDEALVESTSKGTDRHRADNADVEVLRRRLRDAVRAIKTSRLGQVKGREALYELPWYMVIGNPAAGKSSAVINSGLRFPFTDDHGAIIQGIGGTRNCDWYFTTEGILLDTAGRYSVQEDNRSEWLSFLDLLRKYRPRAPINGIIIAASIAELTTNRPEFAIDLAKKLRQRVQELTERLEVIAPVYVIFTKADLIAGFNDFFAGMDETERNRVWGATLPFQADGRVDAVTQVDRYFDELSKGLREMSLAQMAVNRGRPVGPGMLTLPLEFAAIKAVLRTFIATLFEDNPYQYRPVFRGFYFTSALQEPASLHKAAEQIARRFELAPSTETSEAPPTSHGYFLNDLFRKVIFADRQMVQQYSNKQRTYTRYAVLVGAAVAMGVILGAWAWSYTNNRQLIRNTRADLDHAVAIQRGNIDLQSRLQALQVLQDRLHQLDTYHHNHPLMLGLGLYQGNAIEAKVRAEYFAGMRQVMLAPATQNLESYLQQVVQHRSDLRAPEAGGPTAASVATARQAGHRTYQAPSPTDPQEAYNALKAYLMLAQPRHVEPMLLSDQLTRFWRLWLEIHRGAMTRDRLVASAQHLMTFYVSQYTQPDWPTVHNKVALVEDSRSALRDVLRGMSAMQRVYAQITARAATRFPAITVASMLGEQGKGTLAGSYSVPGPFSREAWRGYVRSAIENAANNELNTNDWVLQSRHTTDLSLTGSPEHIEKQLRAMYEKDYISRWQNLLKGVTVQPFDDFTAAVHAMNTLGDPRNSPLRTVLEKVHAETSWDNPAPAGQGPPSTGGGLSAWFSRVILRRSTHGGDINRALDHTRSSQDRRTPQTGAIGAAFAGVGQIMATRGGDPSLFAGYMDVLSKLRTQLNAIQNQGKPGPGARALMAATLNGGKSGLTAGLQWVDEQMLNGLDDQQRHILRPLLLRPFVESFQALVAPTEADVNKTWKAQVYEPFQADLARKYPFDTDGQIQATASEIRQIFGPTGAIAKFTSNVLGPLVHRRGDVLIPRQWAGVGINLSSTLMTDFGRWTAPLNQTTNSGSGDQTVFQIRPQPAAGGISGYTININGQQLRYRNTPPVWKSFVWSGTEAAPVAQVHATTLDGRSVTIENFTGTGALSQLFRAATGGLDKQTGIYSLNWNKHGVTVSVQLRIVSSPQVTASGARKPGLAGTKLPATVVGTTNHLELAASKDARPTS